MSKLIKLDAAQDGANGYLGAVCADDRFTLVADDEAVPPGDVIITLDRYLAEGEALAVGRDVGVLLGAGQPIEALVYDLPRIPVVALSFDKFADGRHYTSAQLLRQRHGYKGEVRAVGEVLREQARLMVRCGFDAFAPADGSTPEQWAAAAGRFRHVYQRASDGREPIFAERDASQAEGGR